MKTSRAISDRNNVHQTLKSNRHEAAIQIDYKVKEKNLKLLMQCEKKYFRNKFTECPKFLKNCSKSSNEFPGGQ